MKVTITEHGGFAPGIRRPSKTVDSESLPADAAKKLTDLVSKASEGATAAAAAGSSRVAPDSVSYVVQIEDSGKATELRLNDANMTQPFADLVQWLHDHKTT